MTDDTAMRGQLLLAETAVTDGLRQMFLARSFPEESSLLADHATDAAKRLEQAAAHLRRAVAILETHDKEAQR